MRKLSPAFWVGMMVIAGAGTFVYLFGAVDKSATSETQSYEVGAILEDVSGLALHSRVSMSGIPIGELQEIALDPVSGRHARVKLRIRKDVTLYKGIPTPDGLLINGAVLTRKQASLLGDYYLDLTTGTAGDVLKDGDDIPTVVSVSGLSAVIDKMEGSGDLAGRLNRIAANIEAITESLAEVVGGQQGTHRLDGVLDDIAIATRNIAEASGEMRGFLRDGVFSKQENIDRIIGNVEQFTGDAAHISGRVDASLARSLANVEALTEELREMAGRSSGSVDRVMAGAEASLTRLQKSLDKVERSLAHVESISGKIDRGEGTVGRLVNDSQLIDDATETVEDVGGLIKSFARLETRVELRVEYGFLESSTKTYMALRLQPRRDRWYQFELIDDPRGNTRFSTRVTETNDPSLPPVLRESTTSTSDELKFSLFFAKRFHFLVGRLGIIESTGGGGLDVLLFDDTVKLSVDLFDIAGDRTPRLKTMASWRLFDHLLIQGGVDDILDDRRRDYFLGMGLTFTDSDLKALLTVAPTPSQ